MVTNLYNGRPADLSGRLDKEIRVYDMLDSLGIEYCRIDHTPAGKMEACREIDEKLGVVICKNLFLCNRQKTRFYLLMMPADKPYRTRIFSKLAGSSRLSFGTPEDMERLLDLTPGSVSILGLMNDKDCTVKLYIDQDVLDGEYIGCHPCINTSSLRMKTADILEKFLPAVHHEYTAVTMPYDEE
ncbi:MAG: prolyl-tRNA synthetase associated domain-containing protein [Clostridia bacterium]|nr:prolyl-tRNA synthetase associated domain-containing protein [Clostridia bacterium]